jgi:histidinol-phosphatase (PHP family)
MILDFHIHSNTSPDNKLEIDQIYAAAVEKNLKYVCITNHHEFIARLSDLGFTLDEIKIKKYLDHFSNLKLNSATKIFFGTEIGYWENKEEEIKQFINSVKFDFVIGSVHGLGEIELSNSKSRFKIKNQPELQQQIVEDYFVKLKNAIKSQLFDVIGHIDIFKKIMPEPDFDTLKIKWEEIADLLVQHDIGFEINTSYKNYFGEKPELAIYPNKEIVKLFVEKGVKKITIGSDTHAIEQVGNQIEKVEEFLKSLDVKQICYFKERNSVFVDL